MKSLFPPAVVLSFVVFAYSACASGPVEVPEDTSAAKIIQKAQEASDTNKYRLALGYYEALKERYGHSAEYLCVSEYETAFIHYKQKKYLEARLEFESLLVRYSAADAARLPAYIKILSEKVLAKIIEKGY